VLLAASAAVLLAACSSSSPSSSATAAASGSSSAAASGSGNAQAQAAQQIVDKWLKTPTTIGATTPLEHAPTKGETFVDLQCELEQCAQFTVGEKAAAAAAGWKLVVITFQNSNPATLIAAMQQALQYHPAGVSVPGLPEATWAAEIPAYKAAKVPIILLTDGATPIAYPVVSSIGGPDTSSAEGSIMANWFIADSGAAGKVLLVDASAYPVFAGFIDTFNSTVKAGCTNCSVTPLDASIPEIENNGLIPAVVSALQRDPSIKYVISCDGPFIDGLPSALQAAGLSGIKIGAKDLDAAEGQNLINGTGAAFTGQALHYEGWAAIDVGLRESENMPVSPTDGGVPQQLLTRATVGTPSNSFDRPSNFPQLFEALWKVGS
jgi:ribose transport system substrate-binding protein